MAASSRALTPLLTLASFPMTSDIDSMNSPRSTAPDPSRSIFCMLACSFLVSAYGLIISPNFSSSSISSSPESSKSRWWNASDSFSLVFSRSTLP